MAFLSKFLLAKGASFDSCELIPLPVRSSHSPSSSIFLRVEPRRSHSMLSRSNIYFSLLSRSSDCNEHLADAPTSASARLRSEQRARRPSRWTPDRPLDDRETRAAGSEIDVRGGTQRPTDGPAFYGARWKVICEEWRGIVRRTQRCVEEERRNNCGK